MKSKLLELKKKHRQAIEALRDDCPHLPSYLKIYKDHSVIGCGTRFPRIEITCRNCGKQKTIFFETDKEYKIKIEKTLKRQIGIRDQRLGGYAQYDYELQ